MRTFLGVLIACVVVTQSSAGSIRGLVISDDGKPVANAEIAAYAVEAPRARLERIVDVRPRPVLAKTSSQTDGAFTIDVPGHGVVVLGITAPDFVRSFSAAVIGDEDVFIDVARAKPEEWRVESAGKPVPNARVVVFAESGEWEVKSDASGRFVIAASVTNALLVFADGYAPQIAMSGVKVVTLDRGRAVSGQVFGFDQRGVAGARIYVNSMPLASTAPDGKFSILHIPSNTYMIEADAGEFAGSVTGTKNPVKIALRKQLPLAGIVRDREGHPLCGVTMAATVDGSEGSDAAAVSDENGAFAFHLVPGKYALSIDGEYESDMLPVDSRKTSKVEIVASRRPAITGTVRMQNGEPVANARVALAVDLPPTMDVANTEMIEPPSTMTNGAGHFRLPLPPEETSVRVEAVKSGLPPAESEQLALHLKAAAPVSIVIPNGVDVPVQVTDTAEKPVAGVAIAAARAQRITREAATAITDANGRATLHLAQGNWRVTATKNGYAPKVLRSVDAKSGPIAMQIDSAVAVRGHVLTHDRKPVAGVTLALEGTRKMVVTSDDGSFAFTDVEKGQQPLQYRTSDGVYGSQLVAAPSDDVRIVLAATGSFSGHVLDPTGAPVTEFDIEVRQPANPSTTLRSSICSSPADSRSTAMC